MSHLSFNLRPPPKPVRHRSLQQDITALALIILLLLAIALSMGLFLGAALARTENPATNAVRIWSH